MTRMSIPRDALHAEVKLAAFGIHSIMLGLFLALVFAVIHYTRRAHPRPKSAGAREHLRPKSAGAREYPGSTGAREHLSRKSTSAREQPRSVGASLPAPKNEWTREDQLLFAGSVALIVTTSANWICSCLRLLKAYHTSGGSSPSHIEMDNTVSAAQMVFRVLTWFVADVIVISRVYVIWNGKLGVILLPALSLAVLLASGMAIAYDTAVLDADSPDTTFANWKLVNSWSTILTNVYCTGMITYRIVRVSRSHAQTGKSPLSAALAALVESAVFYTTVALLTYATAEAEHVSNAFFIEISAPSAALAAVVIHVRAVWRRERVGGGMAGGGVVRGERVGGGRRSHAPPKPENSVLPRAVGHTPLGTTGNANREPMGCALSSSAPMQYGRDTRRSSRGSWDVEAQRRGDEASHEAQSSEKDWETKSASDCDSSSTSTLRPMPSAVVR